MIVTLLKQWRSENANVFVKDHYPISQISATNFEKLNLSLFVLSSVVSHLNNISYLV